MIEIKALDSLVVSVEKNFKNLPALPAGGKEFVIMVLPWLAVIFGGFLILFSGLGTLINLVASPLLLLGSGPQTLVLSLISGVLALVEGVLLVLAFKPLKNQQMVGWKLLTYVLVINIVSVIVGIFTVVTSAGILGPMVVVWSLVWSIFWIVVTLYILFQIKSHYK